MTIVFHVSILGCCVFTINERTPTVNALRISSLVVTLLTLSVFTRGIFKAVVSVLRPFLKNSELRLRYLSANEATFVVYAIIILIAGTNEFIVTSRYGFDYSQIATYDMVVFQLNVIVLATAVCLLPKHLARAEIVRSQVC